MLERTILLAPDAVARRAAGYAPDEISFAVRELPDEDADASALLRVALKTLAAAR